MRIEGKNGEDLFTGFRALFKTIVDKYGCDISRQYLTDAIAKSPDLSYTYTRGDTARVGIILKLTFDGQPDIEFFVNIKKEDFIIFQRTLQNLFDQARVQIPTPESSYSSSIWIKLDRHLNARKRTLYDISLRDREFYIT